MNIFLSFIGNNDCYPLEKTGAILTVLAEGNFDRAYLLYNHEKYLKPAEEIRKYCRIHFPKTQIRFQSAMSVNPTDYNVLYPAMYSAVKEIRKQNPDANYTVSLSSGTPAMHACWIFLVKGGVIHARMVQVSVESGISEVNFDLDDFPEIRQVKEIKAEMTRLARENQNLKNRLETEEDGIMGRIAGSSPQMLAVKEQIKHFAQSDISVFIQGESGTGKELVAEALHFLSPRREKPFVTVNCGAISPHLAESEFFGHATGAFTGATVKRDGIFRQADGGTLFLDEIADLPLDMQVKLLRVLENGSFTPVGSAKSEYANVRIISAANRELSDLVRKKKFREDLFWRIMGGRIELPPLRERGNDRLMIAAHLVEDLNRKQGKKKKLEKSAADVILFHHWPGNVRELRNVIETAFVYPGNEIRAEHMHIVNMNISEDKEIVIPDKGLDLNKDVLPKYYDAALKKCGGNQTKAAKLLGLEPHTFRARLRNL
ncbi:MAG: RNA repair transcriptional activator RtcR family protein [Desulfococcaceae bacterium]